jgi:membrane protein implicated in regulation of membrane protease activity
VVVGIVSATVLAPHIDWQCEPPAAIAYVCLLFVGPTAAGCCFLVAAVLRSHAWELAGSIILVGSFAARMVLGRWLRRQYSDQH